MSADNFAYVEWINDTTKSSRLLWSSKTMVDTGSSMQSDFHLAVDHGDAFTTPSSLHAPTPGPPASDVGF